MGCIKDQVILLFLKQFLHLDLIDTPVMDLKILSLRDLLFSIFRRNKHISRYLTSGKAGCQNPSFRCPRKNRNFPFCYLHIRYPLGVTIQFCPPRTDFSVRLFPINTVVNMSAS